jgi:hypothetical protein
MPVLEEESRDASQPGEVLEVADREHWQVTQPGEQLRGLTSSHAGDVEHVARSRRPACRCGRDAHAVAGDHAAFDRPRERISDGRVTEHAEDERLLARRRIRGPLGELREVVDERGLQGRLSHILSGG